MIRPAWLMVAATTAFASVPAPAAPVGVPEAVDVGAHVQALVEADWIDADRRFAVANTPPGQPVKINAQGVSTAEDAAGAVDGVKNGKFGARAARLLDYLDTRHYGVELPDEDFHRMVLWLDCNSEFLGADERAEAQARGELVTPALE